jgi:DNA replication protein DnaC
MTESIDIKELKLKASRLKLHGLLAHWDELKPVDMPRIKILLQWEETERMKRGLERRLSKAHLGRFKPLADFDWQWPEQCDKDAVSDMMQLEFIKEASNIILMGPNGVGKSTIAQNIAHHAVMQGYTALFVAASSMLADLAAQDGDNALRRRIKQYVQPQVLVIDELGYLSYGTRHADLLFEIISRRYEVKPTIVTTNKPFSEWGEVFPNASCVVSLVDRLIHHSEIIVVQGESYRMKEAQERADKKKAAKTKRSRSKPTKK